MCPAFFRAAVFELDTSTIMADSDTAGSSVQSPRGATEEGPSTSLPAAVSKLLMLAKSLSEFAGKQHNTNRKIKDWSVELAIQAKVVSEIVDDQVAKQAAIAAAATATVVVSAVAVTPANSKPKNPRNPQARPQPLPKKPRALETPLPQPQSSRASPPEASREPQPEAWTEVGRKKKKKTRSAKAPESRPARRPRARKPLETITIGPADSDTVLPPSTYADVLRKLHTAPTTSPGESCTIRTMAQVRSVRRTTKGELVLKLVPGKGAEAVKGFLKDAAGPGTRVDHEVPRREVLIRDLCEGAETQSVLDALCRVLGEDCRSQVEVSSMRPAYNGTYTCTAKVPWSSESGQLVRLGRLRVGLMRCRVRSKVDVPKCFRCFGYGHKAAQCNADDRKGLCMRCGGSGHLAAKCEESPRCPLCAKDGKDAEHRSGSNQCEAFKRALRKAQKW
mgnify:FL=1